MWIASADCDSCIIYTFTLLKCLENPSSLVRSVKGHRSRSGQKVLDLVFKGAALYFEGDVWTCEVQFFRQRPFSKIWQIRENPLSLRALETISEPSKISTIATNFASQLAIALLCRKNRWMVNILGRLFSVALFLKDGQIKTIKRRIKAILSLELLSYTSAELHEMAERS